MCGWWCLRSSTSRSFCVTGLNAGWLWTNLKAIYNHHWHPVLCTTTQQQQHSAIVEKIMFSPISEATYGTLMCDYFNRVVWFCFTSIFLLNLTWLNCWFKLCMEPKSRTCFMFDETWCHGQHILFESDYFSLSSWYSYTRQIKWLFMRCMLNSVHSF